jgi:hypothetical protein
MTYLCYIDESGTADIPGNTSQYVLCGLSIPIGRWHEYDLQIERLKQQYMIVDSEIHVAWIMRHYQEQNKIPEFDKLDFQARRSAVQSYRKQELYRLQKSNNPKQYKQTRKNYRETEAYIHLTLTERQSLVKDMANCIGSWTEARLFAECIDKVHFDPNKATQTPDEQAFEQIVSRFEQYLQKVSENHGLLIHDNNETVAKRHTALMKRFHETGTLWTDIKRIVETPLFVDSQLTSMVQVADLCAYALRRYLENGETELFDEIFRRADRNGRVVVGVRHFTRNHCECKICKAHRP